MPADGTVVNGYLNNRPTLQKLQQLSYALLGARNTVTFNATESQQQPLGVVSGLTDDFLWRTKSLSVVSASSGAIN
ncbi:MAG: hypothetical protein V5B44_18190 [Candidatus Accumulibacter necessarius]|uniref:hypothetical protein n=1 Tax=Candidatus Accumulibacter necessarius TaxID=2954386 RepID=UPI002FC331A3